VEVGEALGLLVDFPPRLARQTRERVRDDPAAPRAPGAGDGATDENIATDCGVSVDPQRPRMCVRRCPT
jgi:hypothetical protein